MAPQYSDYQPPAAAVVNVLKVSNGLERLEGLGASCKCAEVDLTFCLRLNANVVMDYKRTTYLLGL
jgi:hypothetical protein